MLISPNYNSTVNILNYDKAYKILNNKKCIIVTGVTGQDGSHMIDYLLKNTKDYILFGGVRILSVNNHKNIKHIQSNRFHLLYFDLTDSHAISCIFQKLKPSYFLNFAAQSDISVSWEFPQYTWNTNCTSIIHILESIRKYCSSCRLFQAGSSEEFGNFSYCPQDEKHPLASINPYGASKIASRRFIKIWRETYNLFAIQGWLFNHEGIRRGENFITRKVTKTVAYIDYCIKNNLEFKPLSVGNIYTKRDWSDSEDFIDGIWKMINNNVPKEYVLSSGKAHTVKELISNAFDIVNIKGFWENNNDNPINEKMYTIINNNKILLVQIDKTLFRPIDVNILLGDSSLAKKDLKWKTTITFKELIKKMVVYDCQAINSKHK